MAQQKNSPQPQGIKLRLWHIIGFMLLGGWLLSVKFWAVAAFWGAYLLASIVGHVYHKAGGRDVIAYRAAWIIHRLRHIRDFRRAKKQEVDILKAAQAENKRTGTTVQERYKKEIDQIKDQEKAEKARKRRWFGSK